MIYVVTGHLGSGKTLLAVHLVHEYLKSGRRVASNVTLQLDKLCEPSNRQTAIRLPHIPNEAHLEALGLGYEGPYNEDKFGVVLLDEAGKWLNARDWNDKERRGLFAWLTHARKRGWDVILIVQDYEALDAQIRRSITEVYVQCLRLDRVKVPFLPVRLPRIHRGKGLYGGPQGEKFKTWTARGNDYFAAYDTRESIKAAEIWTDDGKVIDARGSYSMLSAWHLRGRYLPQRAPLGEVAAAVAGHAVLVVLWALLLTWAALRHGPSSARKRRPASGLLSGMSAEVRRALPKLSPSPYDKAPELGG